MKEVKQMTTQNNTTSKLEQLKMVYLQQHYFIDRHDNMAERLINILLVEITAFSIIIAVFANDSTNINFYKIVILFVYLFAFLSTLINLFLIIINFSVIVQATELPKIDNEDRSGIILNAFETWVEEFTLDTVSENRRITEY